MSAPRINDPAVLAVGVEDCGEPLVSLGGLRGLRLAARVPLRRLARGDVTLLARRGVRDRLADALAALPPGLGLEVYSAYRSGARQQLKFDDRVRRLLREHPGLDPGEARERATEFVADPARFAPHRTGGAVDLGLVDADGAAVDVGNRLTYGATARTSADGLTPMQRANRALLIEVMLAAGFVNYPYEWWHWSYGDSYWGYCTGRAAIYGPVELGAARLRPRLHHASSLARTVLGRLTSRALRAGRPRAAR